jgi:hypothetical protein
VPPRTCERRGRTSILVSRGVLRERWVTIVGRFDPVGRPVSPQAHRLAARCQRPAGRSPALGLVAAAWLARQSLRLILDVDGDLSERGGVFPAVVRAEEQLARVREQNADVRLGTAAIAQIEGGQRLCGGYSSGQRRLPLLSASGSDQRRRLAVYFLQQSTTPVPASGFPGPRRVRHKRKPHSIALSALPSCLIEATTADRGDTR